MSKSYENVFDIDKVFTKDFFTDNKDWRMRFVQTYRIMEKFTGLIERSIDRLKGLKDTAIHASKSKKDALMRKRSLYMNDIRFFIDMKSIQSYYLINIMLELEKVDEKYYLSSEDRLPYIADVKEFCSTLEKELNKVEEEEPIEKPSEEVKDAEPENKLIM